MYRIISDSIVRRVADGAFIPADEENEDWQEYQRWIAAGNAPLPPEA